MKKIAISMLLIILSLSIAGCSCTPLDKKEEIIKDTKHSTGFTSPQEAVQNFYDVKQKHGFASFVSNDTQKVEFWFDGDKFRLTWYNPDDTIRLHMISPDGKQVYYHRLEDNTVEIAPVTADKQIWTFNGPPGWTLDDGIVDGKYTVFTYEADKLWTVEGAEQNFYMKDLKVYADDNGPVKIEMRTNSERVPDEDLVYSAFIIDSWEEIKDMDETIFQIPSGE